MNNNVWTIPKPLLQYAYGSFILIALFMLLIDLLGIIENQFYTSYTVFLFLISTILIYKISIQNSVATFVMSFSLTTAFSQRYIITYFYPDEIDFTEVLNFTRAELEYSTLFYLCCVFALFLGVLLGKQIKRETETLEQESFRNQYINFFFLRYNTRKFLKIVIALYCLLVLLKILIISITGIGLTGATHSSSQTGLHWLSSRSGALGIYAFFSAMYLHALDKKNSIKKIFFFFFVIENILMASRALLLGLFQSFIMSCYVLKKVIKKKYIIYGSLFIAVFGGAYYVILTGLRSYLQLGEFSMNIENVFLTISRGFSQLEPLYLWIDMPRVLYENSVGFLSDIKLFVNSFVIGEIFPDTDRLNLGKLMVLYGRGGNFDIFSLGGHAENPGTFAVTYMYLGFLGGALYWLFHGLLLTVIDRSKIHIFWKFSLVAAFGFGPSYVLYTHFSVLIMPVLLILIALMVYELINLSLGKYRINRFS